MPMSLGTTTSKVPKRMLTGETCKASWKWLLPAERQTFNSNRLLADENSVMLGAAADLYGQKQSGKP